MKFIITIFILISLLNVSFGKIYTECELATELSNKFDMKYKEIQNWVCIAKTSSNFDTSRKEHFSKKRIYYHGLFMISDRYWCSHGANRTQENICKVRCSELRSDDIAASVNCARTIYKEGGNSYKRWGKTAKDCKNNLPNLRHCFTKLFKLPKGKDLNMKI
ncbi:lysozyme-like [Chrysoperla carnea]|uniref:lysozyme-like n=1 Tax=Chrysoperla carnea TaxID=189513 RepID=UPI001D072C14|nr:lysozyme-like [Chrysoperla carnea]